MSETNLRADIFWRGVKGIVSIKFGSHFSKLPDRAWEIFCHLTLQQAEVIGETETGSFREKDFGGLLLPELYGLPRDFQLAQQQV